MDALILRFSAFNFIKKEIWHRYIESFAEAKDDSVEAIALAEGVQAMLEAKGSKL